MNWLTSFPQLDDGFLRDFKRLIDDGFRNFTRDYGDLIEGFFSPLNHFLVWSENLLTSTPWPIILLIVAALAWGASHNPRVVIGSIVTLVLIGLFGMWEDTMKTVSMIIAATLLSIAIGLPLGILMARSQRVQAILSPILDVMQTMPSFVYLIPVVMLLGIGRVPGLIAVVIYALPAMIRLTFVGIRVVDGEVVEATVAFGSSAWQILIKAELPLAMQTILAGVFQTILMALAMVFIAAMIGVQGLGQPVLR
ncbi:MAG: ABC transporter permease, partial [Paracoccus sp. (in: a-proteobacteria)]